MFVHAHAHAMRMYLYMRMCVPCMCHACAMCVPCSMRMHTPCTCHAMLRRARASTRCAAWRASASPICRGAASSTRARVGSRPSTHPAASRRATLCHPGLQPCVGRAAALCIPGCSCMQPYASQPAPVRCAEHAYCVCTALCAHVHPARALLLRLRWTLRACKTQARARCATTA